MSKYESYITVNTTWGKSLTDKNLTLIEQTTKSRWCDIETQIMRSVINLQDAGVKKALIELGWTPPPEEV